MTSLPCSLLQLADVTYHYLFLGWWHFSWEIISVQTEGVDTFDRLVFYTYNYA